MPNDVLRKPLFDEHYGSIDSTLCTEIAEEFGAAIQSVFSKYADQGFDLIHLEIQAHYGLTIAVYDERIRYYDKLNQKIAEEFEREEHNAT